MGILLFCFFAQLAAASDLPPEAPAEWNQWSTPLWVVSQGSPNHSIQDLSFLPGSSFQVVGKFNYGRFAKDLEGETIGVWIEPQDGSRAGRWQKLGEGLTDSNGKLAFNTSASALGDATRARIAMVVRGDLSHAEGELHRVTRGKKSVVFDIDGTLTINDAQLWEEVLMGSDPIPQPDAVELTQIYAHAGFEIYYVTGRPYLLDGASRSWLSRHGFAPGLVRTTDSLADVSPDESHVQRYKREVLQSLSRSVAPRFMAVYGNSLTDVCAYAQSGIEPSRTFIIGSNAAAACEGFAATQAVRSYPEHLEVAKKISQTP